MDGEDEEVGAEGVWGPDHPDDWKNSHVESERALGAFDT